MEESQELPVETVRLWRVDRIAIEMGSGINIHQIEAVNVTEKTYLLVSVGGGSRLRNARRRSMSNSLYETRRSYAEALDAAVEIAQESSRRRANDLAAAQRSSIRAEDILRAATLIRERDRGLDEPKYGTGVEQWEGRR